MVKKLTVWNFRTRIYLWSVARCVSAFSGTSAATACAYCVVLQSAWRDTVWSCVLLPCCPTCNRLTRRTSKIGCKGKTSKNVKSSGTLQTGSDPQTALLRESLCVSKSHPQGAPRFSRRSSCPKPSMSWFERLFPDFTVEDVVAATPRGPCHDSRRRHSRFLEMYKQLQNLCQAEYFAVLDRKRSPEILDLQHRSQQQTKCVMPRTNAVLVALATSQVQKPLPLKLRHISRQCCSTAAEHNGSPY